MAGFTKEQLNDFQAILHGLGNEITAKIGQQTANRIEELAKKTKYTNKEISEINDTITKFANSPLISKETKKQILDIKNILLKVSIDMSSAADSAEESYKCSRSMSKDMGFIPRTIVKVSGATTKSISDLSGTLGRDLKEIGSEITYHGGYLSSQANTMAEGLLRAVPYRLDQITGKMTEYGKSVGSGFSTALETVTGKRLEAIASGLINLHPILKGSYQVLNVALSPVGTLWKMFTKGYKSMVGAFYRYGANMLGNILTTPFSMFSGKKGDEMFDIGYGTLKSLRVIEKNSKKSDKQKEKSSGGLFGNLGKFATSMITNSLSAVFAGPKLFGGFIASLVGMLIKALGGLLIVGGVWGAFALKDPRKRAAMFTAAMRFVPAQYRGLLAKGAALASEKFVELKDKGSELLHMDYKQKALDTGQVIKDKFEEMKPGLIKTRKILGSGLQTIAKNTGGFLLEFKDAVMGGPLGILGFALKKFIKFKFLPFTLAAKAIIKMLNPFTWIFAISAGMRGVVGWLKKIYKKNKDDPDKSFMGRLKKQVAGAKESLSYGKAILTGDKETVDKIKEARERRRLEKKGKVGTFSADTYATETEEKIAELLQQQRGPLAKLWAKGLESVEHGFIMNLKDLQSMDVEQLEDFKKKLVESMQEGLTEGQRIKIALEQAQKEGKTKMGALWEIATNPDALFERMAGSTIEDLLKLKQANTESFSGVLNNLGEQLKEQTAELNNDWGDFKKKYWDPFAGKMEPYYRGVTGFLGGIGDHAFKFWEFVADENESMADKLLTAYEFMFDSFVASVDVAYKGYKQMHDKVNDVITPYWQKAADTYEDFLDSKAGKAATKWMRDAGNVFMGGAEAIYQTLKKKIPGASDQGLWGASMAIAGGAFNQAGKALGASMKDLFKKVETGEIDWLSIALGSAATSVKSPEITLIAKNSTLMVDIMTKLLECMCPGMTAMVDGQQLAAVVAENTNSKDTSLMEKVLNVAKTIPDAVQNTTATFKEEFTKAVEVRKAEANKTTNAIEKGTAEAKKQTEGQKGWISGMIDSMKDFVRDQYMVITSTNKNLAGVPGPDYLQTFAKDAPTVDLSNSGAVDVAAQEVTSESVEEGRKADAAMDMHRIVQATEQTAENTVKLGTLDKLQAWLNDWGKWGRALASGIGYVVKGFKFVFGPKNQKGSLMYAIEGIQVWGANFWAGTLQPAIFTLLNLFNPAVLIALVVVGVGVAVGLIFKKYMPKSVQKLIDGTLASIKKTVALVGNVLSTFLVLIKDTLMAGWKIIKAIMKPLITIMIPGILPMVIVVWGGLKLVFGAINKVLEGTVWIMQKISGFMGWVGDAMTKAGTALNDMLIAPFKKMSDFIGGFFKLISPATDAIKNLIGTIWDGIKGVVSLIWELDKAIVGTLWEGVKLLLKPTKLWLGIVWGGLKLIGGLISWLLTPLKWLGGIWWKGFKKWLGDVKVEAAKFNKQFIKPAFNKIKGFIGGVTDIVKGIGNFFSYLSVGMENIWKNIMGIPKRIWEFLKESAGNVWDSVVGFFRDLPGKLLDMITSGIRKYYFGRLFLGEAKEEEGGFGSSSGGVKGYAIGGIPPLNQVSMVGERGPEIVMPKTNVEVLPMSAAGALMGRLAGKLFSGLKGELSSSPEIQQLLQSKMVGSFVQMVKKNASVLGAVPGVTSSIKKVLSAELGMAKKMVSTLQLDKLPGVQEALSGFMETSQGKVKEFPTFDKEREAAQAAEDAKRKKEAETLMQRQEDSARVQNGQFKKVMTSITSVNTNSPSNNTSSSSSSTVNNTPITPYDMTLVQLAKGIS